MGPFFRRVPYYIRDLKSETTQVEVRAITDIYSSLGLSVIIL